MKNFIKTHLKFSIKLIVLAFFILLFILFIILKINPDIAEFWSLTFVKHYVLVVGAINKYIPISFTEILAIIYIGLAITFIVFGFIHLFKKRWFKALNSLVTIAIMVFSVLGTYQLTAEMMYNRYKPTVPMYNQWVEKENFKTIVNYFIDDLKVCCDNLEFTSEGDIIMPYDFQKMNDIAALEYQKYNSDYLFPFTTKTKPMYLLSWLYREFHITGVTFIPLGEANIDILSVNACKPFTICHELAHTKGAMREEDADLFATYISLHSDDYYFRYSAYYYSIGSLLALGKYTGNPNDYNELYWKLDERFRNNLSFSSNYWKEHSKGKDFAKWWNDLYLKISGQAKGTGSYGDSETIVNPETQEITSFSDYQKMYFEIYYSKHSI